MNCVESFRPIIGKVPSQVVKAIVEELEEGAIMAGNLTRHGLQGLIQGKYFLFSLINMILMYHLRCFL